MPTSEEESAAKIVQTANDNAADIVVKATNTAEDLIDKATQTALNLIEKNKKDMHSSIVEVVGDALGQNPTRYVDVSRIPLICKSIIEMNAGIKDLNNNYVRKDGEYWVVRTIVFSGAAIVLTTCLVALLSFVIFKR